MTNSQPGYNDIFPAGWIVTGIRQDGGSGHPVVITGAVPTTGINTQTLLYRGPLYPTDSSGSFQLMPVFSGQDVTSATFYGPNTPLFDPSIGEGNVRAVGSYKYTETGAFDHSMMYEGPFDGTGTWTPINVPDELACETVANTIAHSTMGDLVVGDYDLKKHPASANAFIYNIKTGKYLVLSIGPLATAYGIWRNGGAGSSSYTIVGGYDSGCGINQGYLVDYDSATHAFTNLTSFTYGNEPGIFTHFEGITEFDGGYSMAAMYTRLPARSGAPTFASAAFASVKRNSDGSFGKAKWVSIASQSGGLATGNSVLRNDVIGFYISGGAPQSYVATVGASGASA